MFAIQMDTTGKPYQLFVAKHEVALSMFVRSTLDSALKVWKTQAGAERWLAARRDGTSYRDARIITV
jgi:hypothetical protein